MDKFFFPLKDGYHFGKHLNKELNNKLGTKLIQSSHVTGLLCQATENIGDGNYLEIGSLFGGSAITVALAKKHFGFNGGITCIEPKPKYILKNAEIFGISNKIQVIEMSSRDLLLDNYVDIDCTFIDGDHRNPHPIKDFWLVEPITKKYIIFDDYDKSEKGVQYAVDMVISSYFETWRPVHISDAIAIFERINYESRGNSTC